tara:strand:+ start:233 stop:667 length:435 start_codon:yes stop_codon:yes gene_type:complete
MSSPFQKAFSAKSPLNSRGSRNDHDMGPDNWKAHLQTMHGIRDHGGPSMKSPAKTGDEAQAPETNEQKKALDRVAAINDRYVVSSGGVDLGTIPSSTSKNNELGGWDNETKSFSFKLNDSDRNLMNSFVEAGQMAQTGVKPNKK